MPVNVVDFVGAMLTYSLLALGLAATGAVAFGIVVRALTCG